MWWIIGGILGILTGLAIIAIRGAINEAQQDSYGPEE